MRASEEQGNNFKGGLVIKIKYMTRKIWHRDKKRPKRKPFNFDTQNWIFFGKSLTAFLSWQAALLASYPDNALGRMWWHIIILLYTVGIYWMELNRLSLRGKDRNIQQHESVSWSRSELNNSCSTAALPCPQAPTVTDRAEKWLWGRILMFPKISKM